MSSLSAAERVESALDRIAQDDLNAWSYLDREGALAAAHASDQRRADGKPLSSIDGLIIGIKANIAVGGWPWAGGLRSRRDVHAQTDADVITHLHAAGAILLGQTTMDAGALGASGRSMQGPIRHPLDPSRSVGGSSGGSAAAVAAGHCDAAIGSDTIGSVRIPAALCGLVGFKPSPGLLALSGVIPVHEDFDHLGPLARTTQTTRNLLASLGALTPLTESRVRSPRCAVMSSFGDVELDPSVDAAFRDAITRLGGEFECLPPQQLELRKVRRAIFALCEHRMWLAHREQLERTPEDYDEPLRSMLTFGATLDANKLDRYRSIIAEFRRNWRSLTDRFDAILLPTSPVTAFAHALPTPDSLADLTVIATANGSPAITIPLATESLPAGLQIVGKPSVDSMVLELAETLSG